MAKKLTRIKAELLDGRTFECETTTHMCQADRYAFEKRFQTGSGVLVGLTDLFEKTGERTDDGEEAVRIAKGRDGGEFHEVHLGFFAWRALTRGVPALAQMSFDEFVEQVADLEIEDLEQKDTDRVDPSRTVPQPV